MQAMMVDVTGRMPPGARLPVVKSTEPSRPRPRAYSPAQVRAVAARQAARNALATEIAHASGIRAHELLTLGRPAEQRPDDRRDQSQLTGTAAEGMKFAGRDGVVYTVVGKGGLVREVMLPHRLAERLEERRLDAPAPRRRPRRALPATLRHRRRQGLHHLVLEGQHRDPGEEPGRPRSAPRIRPVEDAGARAPRRAPPRARHRLRGAWAPAPRRHANLPQIAAPFRGAIAPASGSIGSGVRRIPANPDTRSRPVNPLGSPALLRPRWREVTGLRAGVRPVQASDATRVGNSSLNRRTPMDIDLVIAQWSGKLPPGFVLPLRYDNPCQRVPRLAAHGPSGSSRTARSPKAAARVSIDAPPAAADAGNTSSNGAAADVAPTVPGPRATTSAPAAGRTATSSASRAAATTATPPSSTSSPRSPTAFTTPPISTAVSARGTPRPKREASAAYWSPLPDPEPREERDWARSVHDTGWRYSHR